MMCEKSPLKQPKMPCFHSADMVGGGKGRGIGLAAATRLWLTKKMAAEKTESTQEAC